MRKISLLLLLLCTTAVFAAEKVIKLPKPNLKRSGTVMQALSDRCSTREYAVKALTPADLSDLLWAANGVNRVAENKRTAPSAMNKQDVDVYVLLPEGGYLYDAKAHQLTLVAAGDFRTSVAGRQEFAKTAPAVLLLVSDISRFGENNERNRMMGAMDAGIVSQNISVFCAVARLGTVARATMDAAGLKTALKLKESQVPMLNHPVGYLK